jgi:hypothetical protein
MHIADASNIFLFLKDMDGDSGFLWNFLGPGVYMSFRVGLDRKPPSSIEKTIVSSRFPCAS